MQADLVHPDKAVSVTVEEALRRIGSRESQKRWLLSEIHDICALGRRDKRADVRRDIVRALRFCRDSEIPIPDELIEVIQQQLKVAGQPRQKSKRERERHAAIELLARNPNLSSKKVAKSVGVTLPTITRWRSDLQFQEEIRGKSDFLAELERMPQKLKKEYLQALQYAEDEGSRPSRRSHTIARGHQRMKI